MITTASELWDENFDWAVEHCGLMQDRRELRAVCHEMRGVRPRRVLEIGSHKGGWIAAVADTCRVGTIYVGVDALDAWKQPRAQVQCRVHWIKTHWLTHKGDYDATLDKVRAILPVVDVLHIDGDHSYRSVRGDWETYAHLVRPGGLVIFHDMMSRRHDGPRRFLDEMRRALKYRAWCDWLCEYFHPPHGMGVAILRRAADDRDTE